HHGEDGDYFFVVSPASSRSAAVVVDVHSASISLSRHPYGATIPPRLSSPPRHLRTPCPFISPISYCYGLSFHHVCLPQDLPSESHREPVHQLYEPRRDEVLSYESQIRKFK